MQAQPSFQRIPRISVRTAVAQRRKKLVEQIAVRAVDFHAVVIRLFCSTGRLCKIHHYFLDILRRHRLGNWYAFL